ncbi:M91 family zinc metallopeptidase [Nocardia sp. XZ_19_385]|uniref:M91 family zinc metallopeptidase n=1 Tax=Nocardia sp. XZ_19_385 TaxID=2769488 RepID=UPI00188E5565|nr:M91 family zinc metallopeptidase [Nocardia sp. XZ_19_385]
MPTLSQLQQWKPATLTEAGQRVKSQNNEFVSQIGRLRSDIQAAQTHWSGEAYWAAYNRIGEDHTAGTQLAQEVNELADAMTNGAATVASYRDVVLARVADATEAGLAVADDWVVRVAGAATETDRAAHQGLIDSARSELATATADVTRTLAAPRDAVRERGTQLGDHALILNNQPTITAKEKSVLIETTDADDIVSVDTDPATGAVTVTVNGEKHTYTGDQAANITIKTRGGEDLVTVSEGTTVGIKVEGGDGKDTLTGGKGRDYLDGGAGADTIHGGDGNDVVYGGADNDTLFGGAGDDYVEGGSGDDKIAGHAGNDQLSGGLGSDTIEGNEGDDKIYAGDGKDTVSGSGVNTAANSAGNDTIYAQDGEDTVNRHGANPTVVNVELTEIPSQIVVSGSPEFQERVRSDLEFLRSSPTGQQMLASFATSEYTVTIVEDQNGRNSAMPADRYPIYYDENTGTKGKGSSATVFYDPRMTNFNAEYSQYSWSQPPPSVTLYHELAHANDFTQGTYHGSYYKGTDTVDSKDGNLANAERVAVGLPIDHDNNPSTPEQLAPEHSTALTENALRAELGLPAREHYDHE